MEFYRTLLKEVEAPILKVKGSKFIAYAFPVQTPDEAEILLRSLKGEHPKANHCCYAWRVGTEQVHFRHNDDGEPTNSAGKPIYGQILSFELTNVLIAVIRYFGGTKLGVGGLIQAYRESARMALSEAEIVEREIKLSFELDFEYAQMDKVMRVVKEKKLEIVAQDMKLNVRLRILVGKFKEDSFLESMSQLHDVKLKRIDQNK